MAKDCPYCGLINPPETIRCECGYHFETRIVEGGGRPRSSFFYTGAGIGILAALYLLVRMLIWLAIPG